MNVSMGSPCSCFRLLNLACSNIKFRRFTKMSIRLVFTSLYFLEEMARLNPDSQNIFEDSVLDTFYPQRPAALERVCLYDFVANYEFQGVDTNGQRVYKKLSKPKLPNHKIFDLENENQEQNYFYSLMLLFS